MSKESRFFTVTHIVVEEGKEPVISHDDYTNAQKNDAVIKFHELAGYARALDTVKYFRTMILNEWGGIEKLDAGETTVDMVDTNEGE